MKNNNISDAEFYGGRIPEPGEEVVFMDGKAYSRIDIDYIKSQNKKSSYSDKVKSSVQKKVESTSEKSERSQQLDRLVLMQAEATRLKKQLDATNKIIGHIKEDLKLN